MSPRNSVPIIHVKLSISFPTEGILRQTPDRSGRWGRCVFHVNEPVPECDYWVVYDSLADTEETFCDPERVFFIAGEPSTVRRYPKAFLSQFATVVTCQSDIEHPRPILMQQGLPWHVGRRQWGHVNLGFSLGYDELREMPTPVKERSLSVICSTSDGTEGHRKRNRFVDTLAERFAGQVEVFGRGRREVEDKWEALAPYKYSVTLENSAFPNYWTEKIADAYLAETFPFYFGCPNLVEYFPAESFQAIDLDNVEEAVNLIEARIQEDAYERARPFLKRAKELVLDRYNLFALIAELCQDRAGGRKARIRIKPMQRFVHLRSRLYSRVRRWKWV